jgi:hypothetical protein
MKKERFLSIDQLWDHILSRDPHLITLAFKQLTHSEQISVIEHLQIIVAENGWLPVQKESAQMALLTIKDIQKGNQIV